MFETDWDCTWESAQTQMEHTAADEVRLLTWIRRFGVVTATSSDWFYTNKRESKEALKQLVESGSVTKGMLRSSNKKITVYSCEPPALEVCIRQIILENILDSWLERNTELMWRSGSVRVGDQEWRVEVQYGESCRPVPGDNVLWFGHEWDKLKTVVQDGQLASTLGLWEKGIVMRYKNGNWLPVQNW